MSFYEFNVAVSGLHTAKNALSVTMGNVSNAATKGYSRLVTDIKATTPLKRMNGAGMVGTGSTVNKVTQMRNFYLDKKFWTQESKNGEYETKNNVLDILETIMNELGEVGATLDLNNLFNSLSEASTFANDDSFRTSVITFANTFAIDLNTVAAALYEQQIQLNDEVYATVTKINALGKQISALTQEIYAYEMGSQKEASALRDQRNLLIDELSQFINIEVKEVNGDTESEYDKKFFLLISGQEFVSHFAFSPIRCEIREEKVHNDDYPYLYDIFFSNDEPLNIDGLSGQLGGLLQIRDGNAEITEKIFSGDYIDTPKLNVTNSNGSAVINAGSAVQGKYRFNLNILNGNTINLNGYDNDDIPGGLSAYDDKGNPIYQSPTTERLQEHVLSTITLNPQYQNPDGTYNVTLELDLDNKEGSITYTYKDEDGNEKTVTEAVDMSDVRTLSYLTVKGGDDLEIKSASAKQYAEAEVYSGYNGIPYYMSKLDHLCQTLAKAFNLGEYADGNKIEGVTGHYYAYDKDGETGNLFFSYKDLEGVIQKGDIDYSKITALNFSISQELLDSPRNFAASTTYTIGNVADESNNEAALSLLKIKDEETLFQEGNVYSYVNAVSTKMGIDNKQASKYSLYYDSISTTIDNQRLSVSSVNINEEIANLVQYQQLYVASSKLIQTVNQIYNTLINGTI